MDLQKTITLPKCNAGSHYYLSKINVFNFCIHEVKTNKSFFYVWEEYNGRKGSSEIYSCLFKYLNEHVFHKNGTPVPPEERPHKLRIIADNCGGQNKSNKMAMALLRLVHLDYFKRIEMAFLVPGHTYMTCDRKFGHISRELQKQDMIGGPDHLIHFIKVSQNNLKIKGNVYKLKREEIYNIDVLTTKIKDDRVCLIRPVQKTFQQASIIVFRTSYLQGYLLKEAFDTSDFKATIIDVRLPEDRIKEVPLNLRPIELKQKYQRQIKLKKKKIEDFKKMAPVLLGDEEWVENLVEEQKDAINYKDDEDEGLFITHMNIINEVPIRTDTVQ